MRPVSLSKSTKFVRARREPTLTAQMSGALLVLAVSGTLYVSSCLSLDSPIFAVLRVCSKPLRALSQMLPVFVASQSERQTALAQQAFARGHDALSVM